jgi:beta-exotoxin I transport system ATP-binding protein
MTAVSSVVPDHAGGSDWLGVAPDCGAGGLIIETSSLTKQYGPVTALRDCSLFVEQGEVFGLLGPNGAGKTTLLRLLLGYLRPTAGRAEVAGLDCQRQSLEVRRQVAYLPAEPSIFSHMRGRDALRFFVEIRPGGDLRRSLALAERLELDLSRRVGFMSTGMKHKLALVATLGAEVPIYILDEPTASLDPTVRATVLSLVGEAKAAGKTLMFSSHVLPEVEEICDRVVILRNGQLVHTQPMAPLRRQHRIVARLTRPMPAIPVSLTGQLAVVSQADGEVVLETPGELAPLLAWLATLPLADMRIEPLGLRNIYQRFHADEGRSAILTERRSEGVKEGEGAADGRSVSASLHPSVLHDEAR